MHRRLNRTPAWCLAAVIACISVAAPAVHAQMVDISDSTRQNVGTLSPAERESIKAYVDENTKNLLSTDPLLVRRDREAILRKLEGENISVSFRLTYAADLEPVLTKMLASDNERSVINGLVIAGELATDRTLAMVQSKATGAPAIRFEAACSMGRVFRAVVSNQPAINQLENAVQGLERLIAAEKNAHVRDALIKSGLAAMNITAQRRTAISAVARGAAASIRAMGNGAPDDAELIAMMRASVGLRDVAARAVQQRAAMPGPAAKDMAEFSGVALSYVSKVVSAAGRPAAVPSRTVLVQLVTSAQATIELSGQLLSGSPFSLDIDLAGSDSQPGLRSNTLQTDGKFVVDVAGIVGPNGRLTRSPFDIPADRFR